ncbi:MAG: RES family NAD+ phosphorylase [Duganella sp.]
MRVWRITHRRYALDKLCADAALYGGRWNPVGMPALYAGSSIAITAMEKLIHLGSGTWPPLVLVAVDLPDDAAVYQPEVSALPACWDALPTSTASQTFGGAWLQRGDTLAMKVPSVIVAEENNVVINPMHSAYPQVQLSIVRPFTYDRRLVK